MRLLPMHAVTHMTKVCLRQFKTKEQYSKAAHSAALICSHICTLDTGNLQT